MRFGSREIVDAVFKTKSTFKLGSRTFYKNDPVLHFETLKTSSLEGAVSTVYAQGGRGNARLLAWDGDRTLTLNMEDALLTPESFSVLAGAMLSEAGETADSEGYIKPMYVHMTSQVEATADETIELPETVCWNGGRGANHVTEQEEKDNYHAEADIYVMKLDDSGEVEVEPCVPRTVTIEDGKTTIVCCGSQESGAVVGAHPHFKAGDIVLVDYYVLKTSKVWQIEITPEILSTYFYIEGSTLYRRESDGYDMPAEVIIPKGKVQSNFTVSMASTGDPSTFNFVVDTFPDYTKFDKTKKVLAAIQIIDDSVSDAGETEYRDNCKTEASQGNV